MAEYQAVFSPGVVRLSDRVFIPNDPENPDWIAYQAWLAKDNLPEPVELSIKPPPAVVKPMRVTSNQMIRALDAMSLLVSVEDAAAAAGGLTLALWQHAAYFNRDEPIIAQVAETLKKTDADLDALFVLAAAF